MMSLKPKPQRLKQRVIVQSDHEHKARSSKEHYKLKSRPKYETKVKSRMRSGETIEPERLRQLKSPEKKHVDKVEAKSDYKVRPVHNTETKLNQEIIPKLKIEHKVQPELYIKPVPKYEKERPAVINVEQKERLENKPKPEIIKRDVISQNEQKVQPNLKDKEDIKHEQKVEAEVKAVSPLTIMDDGGIPIEDIVEEQLLVEKPSGEKHELDPMMTRYIEDELQDIMLKIWEELPDNPLSDNEKVVVNKLRNFAGDDIRNVFGLNLTKRLLNVYNPLFVKIQFSGKPDRVNLAVFLRKYNFIAFKRIGKADIFAAQMKTIKDFDRICITKDIMCGEVKVTVNPCYRFTKCPSNLKTTFDDNDEDDDQETTESNEIPKPTDTDAKDTTSKSESCPTKTQQNNAESNINKTTPNAAKPEVNVKTKQDTIPVKTNVDTAEPKNIAGAKPSPAKSGTNGSRPNNAKSETIVAKPSPAISATNESKPNPAKSEANVAKPGPAKSGTNEISNGSKPNCEKSGPNVAKPSPAKSNINVTKPGTSTTAVKVTTAKNNAKTSMNETKAVNTIKKSHEIINRVSNFKSKESKVTDSNNKNKRKAQRVDKNISDNDELDDNEIFALLSEGIVLDECSGSEDD